LLPEHILASRVTHLENGLPKSRLQQLKRSVQPLAIAFAALTLSACGGSGGGGGESLSSFQNDGVGFGFDDDEDGGLNGAIVQSGPYAGLNEECVNTLLAFDLAPVIEFISLTCDPRNVEVDTSQPLNQPPADDVVPDDEPVVITPTPTPGVNSGPADIAGGNFYPDTRTTALLTGPTFGSGSRLNTELVKPLAVQVGQSDPGLELISVTSLLDTDGDDTADFIAVVENTSSEFRCAITLNEIEAFSTAGLKLDAGDSLEFGLLDGEAGLGTFSSNYFMSCLNPGSLGYIVSRRDELFSDVAAVRAESLSSSNRYERADASMLPLTYSVAIDGTVSVTVVNNHSESLELFSVEAIALDDQGYAIGSALRVPLEDLMPGEEIVVNNLFRQFDGTSSTIRVLAYIRPI